MRKTRKKQKLETSNTYKDLVIELTGDGLECILDESAHTPAEAQRIRDIVAVASKHVVIDKTYVKSKENKHEKTFLLEAGWNALCATICDVFAGKCKKSTLDDPIIVDAYKQMLVLYVHQMLEDFNLKTPDIVLHMKPKSKLQAEFFEDTAKEWKTYCGKWQSWPKKRDN